MLFAMIYHNMNIYCLMVHAQQVEERRVSMNSREAHWAKSFDDGSSKGSLISKTSLDSLSGFIIKFLLCSLRIVMI